LKNADALSVYVPGVGLHRFFTISHDRMRPIDNTHRSTCFGRKHGDGYLITSLELPLSPPFPEQNTWTIQFARPTGDLAIGIFNIKVKLAVWIRPGNQLET
jgi:hypothetical protein